MGTKRKLAPTQENEYASKNSNQGTTSEAFALGTFPSEAQNGGKYIG